ncbi:hypothetical protein AArcSl_1615 [Halalkaliarchaeum desulfuricum]|uniref:HNH nuclease domain-containing protein n=1 Tax=Halalkaliarchaeum desulfuricum TaxID=2055893 RepID=A0A343TJH2_9EURY|nr:hypothetical protein AArcSl_1615 [Halalkaliarchaeum desulfuricum]
MTKPDETPQKQEQTKAAATNSPNKNKSPTEGEISQEQTEEFQETQTEREQKKELTTNHQNTGSELDQLREKAMESATQHIPETISTTTTEKPQYDRSTEVKEYVLARADGYCEGCGDPAPFTRKNGGPYLHVHHIHELSRGGADTPNNVIALCPNCHYRVHHGENGEKYNQKLEKKLETIENQSKSA